MANKYYKVIGIIDGASECLFGSFDRSDCVSEIDAERVSWRADGYKGIKIISEDTTDTPDTDVYSDVIFTKHELFMNQAPAFNFELGEDDLLAEALERGFVTKIDGAEDQYLMNSDYND